MSWIRGKIQERKEKEDAKRSSTPERYGLHGRRGGSRQDLGVQGEGLPVRGKSFEGQRQVSGSTSTGTGEGSRVPSGSLSGAPQQQGAQAPAFGVASTMAPNSVPPSGTQGVQAQDMNAPQTSLPPTTTGTAAETTPMPAAETSKPSVEAERPPVATATNTNGGLFVPSGEQTATGTEVVGEGDVAQKQQQRQEGQQT